MRLWIHDSFLSGGLVALGSTEPTGTIVAGSPIQGPSLPWQALGGVSWGKSGNVAYVTNGRAAQTCFVVVDPGEPDFEMHTDFGLNGNVAYSGFAFRMVSDGVGYVLEGPPGAGAPGGPRPVYLYRGNGSGYTLIAQSAGDVHFDSGSKLIVRCFGDNMKVFYGPIAGPHNLILEANDSTYATATKHGLYALADAGVGSSGYTTFDAFSIFLEDAPPNVPTGLTATPTTTTALLEWNAPAGGSSVTGYDVRLDGGAPIAVGNVTDYTLTGLTPGTAYTAEVRATGPAGVSAWVSVAFETLEPPPPPVDPGYFRTWVELGPHTYTGDAGSPPELGVALPLSFGWAMADDATGYPAQHEVGVCSMLLVVASGEDIAGVDVGTRMRVRVWDDPAESARPVATFTGRVADYEIEPHERGIAVRLLGADYMADLAGGGTVGGEPWPEESGDARAARIMAEHGSGWVSDPVGNVLEERAGQPAPAAGVLRDTLTAAARAAAGPYTAPGRVIVTPQVNAAGELENYRGTFVPAESTAIDKVPTAVHRRTSWRRNRITDGRWVHIDHPGGPTVYGDRRGTPRPRLAVPVYDTGPFSELVLAVTPGFSWVSGAPLRLDLQHPDVPRDAVADWLWRDPASPPVPGAGRVVVVSVCDAMPGMFTTYAGVLAAVQFTLEPGGRRYIDFRLRPDVPAYSTVTPTALDEPAGATWADELPGADWYSLRTVLRADYLEHLTP